MFLRVWAHTQEHTPTCAWQVDVKLVHTHTCAHTHTHSLSLSLSLSHSSSCSSCSEVSLIVTLARSCIGEYCMWGALGLGTRVVTTGHAQSQAHGLPTLVCTLLTFALNPLTLLFDLFMYSDVSVVYETCIHARRWLTHITHPHMYYIIIHTHTHTHTHPNKSLMHVFFSQ